jgi:tRNA modification GTPase
VSNYHSTIYALSSGRPPAAIAVVRISGPHARFALETITGRLPKPRLASLTPVRDPNTGETIDEALALWFPGPKSETGEDVAELQLHGGRAVVAKVLAILGQLEGLRMADPGEFTRRAFENGRLDLTAVEGLADLIYAETEAQRRQAFRQLNGFLGERAEIWRARLIEALALVEAGIDFSDEGDVPEDLLKPALAIARDLQAEIEVALVGAERGERLREGLIVAIAGPPNAGKSTLLNCIARREAAIVSPTPGTTRDVIEVHLDLDGYPVTVLDTAGIRESKDPVEMEGIKRALARAAEADLVLWVVDARAAGAELVAGNNEARVFLRKNQLSGSRPFEVSEVGDTGLAGDGRNVQPGLATSVLEARTTQEIWLVKNKTDLGIGADLDTYIKNEQKLRFNFIFEVSALTGERVNELMDDMSLFCRRYFLGVEGALVNRERHRKALESVLGALTRAREQHSREDILAEELRLATRELGRLLGRVDVEDVLDVIFRDFCIGK